MRFHFIDDVEQTQRLCRSFRSPLTASDYKKNLETEIENSQSTGVFYHAGAFPIVFVDHPFDDDFLISVRKQLLDQPFHQKHNDLYRFLQSDDLATIVSPAATAQKISPLKQLRDMLCSEDFVRWIQQVTGVHLAGDRIDMAGQRYQIHDRLLCHDDEIEEGDMVRRIAFIIYLVDEQWSFKDGGRLELFGVDQVDGEKIQSPGEVITRLVPKWNSMAFFEVSPTSYHQVSEILTDRSERVSLTGWFYGPPVNFERPASSLPLSIKLDEISESSVAESWSLNSAVNPVYLSRQSKRAIKRRFAEDSAVELMEFLCPDMYREFFSEISTNRDSCQKQGPPNRRNYFSIKAPKLTNFFVNEGFKRYLEQITGLLLRSDCHAAAQVRVFERGCFTMLNDNYRELEGLDVTMHLAAGTAEGKSSGGNMVYLDDQDALLTVEPVENMISLVYRCGKVQRFVEYLTSDYDGERIDICVTFPVVNDSNQ